MIFSIIELSQIGILPGLKWHNYSEIFHGLFGIPETKGRGDSRRGNRRNYRPGEPEGWIQCQTKKAHVLSLSGDDVLLEINKALSDKFGLEYLKSCVEQEIQKVAERDVVFIATEKGLQAADNADLSEQEIERQNSQACLDGCRKNQRADRAVAIR